MPCTLGRFYFCLVCVFCCAVVTRALSVGHPVSQLCVAAQHTHTHGQSELFAACCRRAALGSFLPSSTSSPPPISRWSVGGKRPELIQKEGRGGGVRFWVPRWTIMTPPDKPRHVRRKRIKTGRLPFANVCFSSQIFRLLSEMFVWPNVAEERQKFCSSCGEPFGCSGGSAWKLRAPYFFSLPHPPPAPPPATLLVKVVTRRAA